MAFTIGEYQDIFLEEADEQLQELNQSILKIERDPNNIEIDTINSIFRTAHSLKSSAAFVGLNDLSDLAHHMENLLQGIRDKTMSMNPEIIEVLFECFDQISSIISSVASGEEPKQDLSKTIGKIKSIGEITKSSQKFEISKPGTDDKTAEKISLPKIQYTQKDVKIIIDGLKSERICYEVDIYISPDAQMKLLKAQLILNNLEQSSDVIKSIPDFDKITDEWQDNIFRVVIFNNSIETDQIKEACGIDLIDKVDLRMITLSQKDNKVALKFHERETIFEEKAEEPKEETVERRIEAKPDENTKEIHPEALGEEKENGQLSKDVSLYDEEHEEIAFGRRKEDKKALGLKIVKVSVDKLDLLLNNVGELVIANSGFFRLYDDIKSSAIDKTIIDEFKNRMDQMSRIAKELQSGIMKTRMVPIGQVLSRFNRPVRDLAKEYKKQIKFIIKGEDTELDKKVIDVIGEPLLHLIRNSIDHGVEPPEERKKVGKSEEAVVTINAYQGGNQIFVEIGDDGRGLDLEKIKKIAVNKGLTTNEMLGNMDETDITNFIFLPGFSTAEVVTDISGRGVGMNVVKETVSELNGSVRIETERGMGTNFILSFPLTLAIIPAIMVKVKKEIYAIPLPDVIETIKITDEDITTIEGREVINLRGEILSLLRLNEFIGIESALDENMKIPVVVVGFGNRKIGVIVDSLEGKQEIVIKSLDENYTNIEGLAGASILGDGSICLILDIASMINKVITDEEKAFRDKTAYKFDEKELRIEINKARDKKGKKSAVMHKETELGDKVKKPEKAESKEEVKPKPATAQKDIFAAKEEESLEVKASDIGITEDRDISKDEPAPGKPEVRGEETLKAEEAGTAEDMAVSEDGETIESESAGEKEQDITEDIIYTKDESDTTESEELSQISDKQELQDDNIEKKVKESLEGFRKELENNINSNVEISYHDGSIFDSLNIDIADMEKINLIANVGVANAADSLSKLLDKSISLSIPEVEIVPIKNLAKIIGDIDTVYLGVFMAMLGDFKGSVLFSFTEESGFELIDILYGLSTGKTKILDQNGESALKEVTNIIGSSLINILSEKTGLMIRPDVPTIIHDYIQSTIDSILLQNSISGEYALLMNTYFFYQDDKILGKLLILSETEELKKMIEKSKNSN